jgi:hypothetical protein
MNKVLIYIVAIAIVILLGFDAYLAIAGKATPTTIVELAVGIAAILAFAAIAFAKTVGGFHWHRKERENALECKLDEISAEIEACRETIADSVSTVETLRDDIDSRLGLKPDAWEATVNTVDEHGKLVPVYSLEPEDTQEDAVSAARNSIEARDAEGNTVENARITLRPVFY